MVPTVRDIARQNRLPDLVLVVVADESDVDIAALEDLPFQVSVLHSERGLTLQRNAALEVLDEGDVLLFLDDDFLMAPDYLANLEELFLKNPEIAMATGDVLADGIHGPGLSHEFGQRLAADPLDEVQLNSKMEDIYNCYGCNMALRAGPVVSQTIRFDQRLKMYCWLEDVDFSRQMFAFGRIVKSKNLRGVHLGSKSGRSSGLRLGYSQVANPLYLTKKGTMSPIRALNILARNFMSNLVRSLYPEQEIDRFGRLKGNFRAFSDLLRGRLKPEQILNFK